MDDSIGDESNDEVKISKSSSSKKRMLESSSSSNEGENATPTNKSSRSSERIKKQRSRSFTMPTKHDIWDTIPTTKTPGKHFDGLRPRKLVNNFTRVTHRYNHDAAYTSDEGDSLDGFLVMEDDSSSDTSDYDDCAIFEDEKHKKKKKRRVIKNRRIVQFSTDSDSDSLRPDKTSVTDQEDADVRVRLREKLLNKRSSVDESASLDVGTPTSGATLDSEVSCAALDKRSARDRGNQVVSGVNGTEESSANLKTDLDDVDSGRGDENVKDKESSTQSRLHSTRVRKKKSRSKRRHSIEIHSSDDAEKSVSAGVRSGETSIKDKADVASSDEGCSETSRGSDRVGEESNSSDSDCVPVSKNRKQNVLKSDSGSSNEDKDGDGDDDEEDCGISRSALQIKARKEKTLNLFKDFKQARSKLESKNDTK